MWDQLNMYGRPKYVNEIYFWCRPSYSYAYLHEPRDFMHAFLWRLHGVQKLSDGPKYSFQLLEFWREEIFIDEIVYIM